MSLNLEPNEIVGYRIRPDYYSFNVVVVKRHGPGSKHAGQEYDTPLSYCKNLSHAGKVIFNHALRLKGMQAQATAEATEGTVADMRALLEAVGPAQLEAEKAVAALDAKLSALKLSRPELIRALNEPTDVEA